MVKAQIYVIQTVSVIILIDEASAGEKRETLVILARKHFSFLRNNFKTTQYNKIYFYHYANLYLSILNVRNVTFIIHASKIELDVLAFL